MHTIVFHPITRDHGEEMRWVESLLQSMECLYILSERINNRYTHGILYISSVIEHWFWLEISSSVTPTRRNRVCCNLTRDLFISSIFFWTFPVTVVILRSMDSWQCFKLVMTLSCAVRVPLINVEKLLIDESVDFWRVNILYMNDTFSSFFLKLLP